MSTPEMTPAVSETKAPKAKKPAKKAEKKTPAKKVVRETSDVPAGERRQAIVKTLRKMGAISAAAAVPVKDAAEKSGFSGYDTYGCLCGHSGKTGSSPTCLVATGHAGICRHEGTKGLCVYLTKKGQKTTFDETPFVRETE